MPGVFTLIITPGSEHSVLLDLDLFRGFEILEHDGDLAGEVDESDFFYLSDFFDRTLTDDLAGDLVRGLGGDLDRLCLYFDRCRTGDSEDDLPRIGDDDGE